MTADVCLEDEGDPIPVTYISLFQFQFSTLTERFILILGAVSSLLAGIGIPLINVVYGEFANLIADRQFPSDGPSTTTMILILFGGGKILVNATHEERMTALTNDSIAFVVSVLLFNTVTLLLLTASVTIFNFISLRQVNRIRIKFFKSTLSQGMAWFDVRGLPNITNKLIGDVNQVQNGIGVRLSIFIYQNTVSVVMLIINFYIGWLLTMTLLVCMIPVMLIFPILNKVQSNISARESSIADASTNVATEVFSNIRTVIAFNGQEKEIIRYQKLILMMKSLGKLKEMITAVGIGVVWFVMYCSYAVAFYYGFRLIIWEEYTPSVLITVFFGVLIAATNISYSGPYWEAFANARGSAAPIFGVISEKSEINPFSDEGDFGYFTGKIEFVNVHFQYPSRPNISILKGLNLKIEAGEVVGITGSSGSGKSTVLQLIQRMYDPLEGSVLVDGKDLRSLNVSWLRRHIGIVHQEPQLFTTTVGENIKYGMPEATEEQIISASITANAHEFIVKMRNQYGAGVGERGSALSGGQRQRIAVARALVRNPKILLLDEVTSALDSESSELVEKGLIQAFPGRTALIVTHKLSILSKVDRILVLDDGVVAEEGSHNELLKKDGIYNKLLKAEQANIGTGTKAYNEDSWEEDPERNKSSVISGIGGAASLPSESSVTTWDQEIFFHRSDDDRYLNVTFKHFLGWNESGRIYLYIGVLASILLGAVLPSVCVLFGEIAGLIAGMENRDILPEVDTYSLIFVIIALLAALFTFYQIYFLGLASIGLSARLRIKTFETIIRQEIAWFDSKRNNLSTLCCRLNDDCSYVQGIVGSNVGVIIQATIAMTLAFIISLFYSWKLTLFTVPFMPLIFVGFILDTVCLDRHKILQMQILESATRVAVEAIFNIKVVHSLSKEYFFLEKFTETLLRQKPSENMKYSILAGLIYALTQTAMFFIYASSLWFGTFLIINDNLHYREIIRVTELIIYGGWVLSQSLSWAPSFKIAKAAAARLQYLFVRRPKIWSGSYDHPPSMDKGGKIVYSNVHFSYPTKYTTILRNVNFSIESGKSVALIGSSGSGKSTILQLLLRFYNPKIGRITIGGVKITDFQLSKLRGSMGFVSQAPVLFDRTVFENIAYGDNDREVKIDEVIVAAEAANIHSFILSLPLGYDTVLGSSFSTQLSGGQKQRITIARALIRNPQILLLDEATSALDAETENALQETLNNAMIGRTTITVAHRLGALANADIIYTVHEGYVFRGGNYSVIKKKAKMNREVDEESD